MLIGLTLRDRYKIISLLGQGHFGETYLAEDLGVPINPKPKRVVKRLKTQNFIDAQLDWVKNAFEQEAATLYKLSQLHPQIPNLLEYFQVKEEFYLVQDFIDGVDLTKIIIPGTKLAELEVIQLLCEILEVLVVVHQQNIIHRDISPKNIMRRQADNKIVLIDFGTVKQIMLKTSVQTSLTIGVGTPGFMPLEQFNGKPKLASDIYAVGMVGIQALTGIQPHLLDDDEDGEVIWRPRVSITNDFAQVLEKMVSRRVSQRYQNATEALEAMQLLNQQLNKPIAPTIILPPSPLANNTQPYNSTLLNKTKSAEIYNNEGIKKFKAGNYVRAIEDYNQAIIINPNYAVAYFNQGNAYILLGDYQAAIQDLNQAIKINPNDTKFYNSRGFAYNRLGNYQAAIQDLNQAIKINPNYAEAYANRGFAYNSLGDCQVGIQDYNQVIKINSNLEHIEYIYLNRGLAYIKLGDYQSAIQDYTQALKINHNFADAYTNRGDVYSNLGDYQAAIQDYTQALKINPNYVGAYNSRGIAHYNLGDYQTAIQDYNQALKINPNYSNVYNNRGLAHCNLGGYQAAIKDYNQALKINPNYSDAYNNRGVAHYYSGDYQVAMEDFSQAANLYKQQGKESEYQDLLNRIKKLKLTSRTPGATLGSYLSKFLPW
ncbi:serine/threonine protein kinase containing TPR domain (plasmid) [Calothrix sp. NIES-4071]|nr:serine/threonine protein kinase containing TPR domain [Calothrix sp. NIES-4071]BAZ65034.1 serine/threonine protein kinase containing TPR domain [Calothrix sp. NIES-4105]